ncbi:polyketide antibiotic transporter [Kribbella sp. NPDC048915]|uniref:ABC transporter permease n=1 Tax=Kribbella sp. NPDC048915 TaxID=3155148 RepID=UPI0033CC30A8
MTELTGTGTLIRFALRRDRVKLPIWIGAIGLGMLYAVSALPTVYGTPEERRVRADLMSSPAAKLMSGPGYGLDDYTLGAMISNEMVLYLAIPAAMMSIFLITRHTRAEEETGRAELIRSTVVGRHAATTAALVVAFIANLGVALVTTLAMLSGGLQATDSLAVGTGIGLAGLSFAGVATITVQLTEHARAASSLAMAVVGAAFLLRAVGDVAQPGGNLLSWLSPLAWTQQARPFVELRWWPLSLSVLVLAATVAFGYLLSARRDVGAGVVRPRLGRADAAGSLSTPFGLATRQQRAGLIGWGVGLFVFAVPMGSLSDSVTDAVSNNPQLAEVFTATGQDPLDAFYSTMALFFGLLVGAFAVISVLRLRAEERTGHTDAALATAVSRQRWYFSWFGFTAVASAVLLALSGLGIGIGAATGSGGPEALGKSVLATLAFLPAVLVVAGLAAALFGVRPSWSALAWIVVGYAAFTGLFGALLDLPAWVADLSPFAHITPSPLSDLEAAPLVVLAILAGGLAVAGSTAFTHRDIEAG